MFLQRLSRPPSSSLTEWSDSGFVGSVLLPVTQELCLFIEAAAPEKTVFSGLGYRFASRGIRVNFGVSDAIEIFCGTQFM
jgi:hypothetical protein